MQNKYDAVVVGAGLGGIAAALRLKKIGYSVLVVEKNKRHGGKLEEIEWEDFRWDRGPSLFTLPHQVDELFTIFGKNPRDYFNYHKMSESCHYYFHDGSNFLLSTDPEERQSDLIKHFYERDGKAANDYITDAEKTYNSIGGLFIDNPKYGLKNIFDKALLKKYPLLLSKKVRGSLNALNKDSFENPNLIKMFDRYATYNGSTPFKTSGLYSMIANLELNDGTYFPTKGMRSIIDSLYDLAQAKGVDFIFNEDQIKVKKEGSHYTVALKDSTVTAQKLISAIDRVSFYDKVLEDKKLAKKYMSKESSSSACILYWAVDKVIPELKLHNTFFATNYETEFIDIFDWKKIPIEPTIYLHVSAVINPQDARANGQNWFLMINSPAGVKPTAEQKEKLKDLICRLIQQHFKVDIRPHILHEENWDSAGIEVDTGSYLGALYGASSNAKLAAITRHGNTSKKYKNMYFVGGTVHPGGGIPLVLKSAKIVADIIEKEKGL